MEKISGILPSSARITAVDTSSSHSVRPGAPAFGRKAGESNLQKNSIVRSAHAALTRHHEVMDKKSKEQQQADMIRDISDQFFKRKTQRDQEEMLVGEIIRDEMQKAESFASEQLGAPVQLQDQALAEEDLNTPEIGRYLNVSA